MFISVVLPDTVACFLHPHLPFLTQSHQAIDSGSSLALQWAWSIPARHQEGPKSCKKKANKLDGVVISPLLKLRHDSLLCADRIILSFWRVLRATGTRMSETFPSLLSLSLSITEFPFVWLWGLFPLSCSTNLASPFFFLCHPQTKICHFLPPPHHSET